MYLTFHHKLMTRFIVVTMRAMLLTTVIILMNIINEEIGRHCRVDGNRVVKVADFGLARFTEEREYYRPVDRTRALPIKWMAIESMTDDIFTTKSDVVGKIRLVVFHVACCFNQSINQSRNFKGGLIVTSARWPSGTVPDLRPRGRGFESRPWLLCIHRQLSVPVPPLWGRSAKAGSKRAYDAMHLPRGLAASAGVRLRAT